MKRIFTGISFAFLVLSTSANAQTQPATDTTGEKKFIPHGSLWGYAFGDWAYKGNADNLNRGGSNQYTGVASQVNLFQFRRIYLGYNFDISPKFSAELLLAAEDDFASGSLGQSSGGDVLTNNKFSPYVKLANLRWKNIWKGTDLVVGQVSTPAFPLLSEVVWGYRSIERTVADIRRTPSFDMGVSLQGHVDKNANFGYDLMVGNGNSAKPESDMYKWFYGDIYAKFFHKHLIIDLYQDYEKINWSPVTAGQSEIATTTGGTTTYALPASPSGLHHDRNMTKLFVAYTIPQITVGVEAFQNTLMGDVQAVGANHKVYYLTTKATAVSLYVRGRITKETLGFFARYDNYDPSHDLKEVTNNKAFTSYKSLTSQYDPTTKEQFVTFGLDYTPVKNVHFMPNLWVNTYKTALDQPDYHLNANGNASKGTDVLYRMTFYYIFR